ncbi:MAG TPA: lysylphosphatidylglycerol synthase transmembrane domain-containing protein [Anaerolineae bacterium]|nr:lysylphosphatidylglycerol synthase transmembrane domain-containing protein [Anaerolineae bacterium]HPL27651.1 lysylphosphatidylglycerol synthase transmembrane domain-containing protein [Anaerolineae bacterium]
MKQRVLAWLRRRWLYLLIVAAFIVLVVLRFADIKLLAQTLVRGRWPFILAAVGLQLLYYLLLGLLYRFAFAVVEVESTLRELLPVVFASVFVSTLTPSGGIGGAALFVDDAARHGQSPAKAAEGVLLVSAAQNLALVPVLAWGLAYLAVRGALQTYMVVGSTLFLLIVLTLTGALILGRWRRGWLCGLLALMQRIINQVARRIRRPDILPESWAEANANEYCEAATAIVTRPRPVAYTMAMALAHTAANLATLAVIFAAYSQPVPAAAVVAGYALSVVFAVLSVLPFDAGLMQGVMAVVYTGLGVPTATAIAIVLVFGGLNAYLPLLVGFFLLREVRAFGGGPRG